MHEIYLIKCKIPISINATAESGYNKINTNSIYEQFKISFNAKPSQAKNAAYEELQFNWTRENGTFRHKHVDDGDVNFRVKSNSLFAVDAVSTKYYYCSSSCRI